MKKHLLLLVPMVPLILAGCGNTTRGPGSDRDNFVPNFTSFKSIKGPDVVTIKGIGTELAHSVDADGDVTVTPYSTVDDVYAGITFAENDEISKVSLDTGATKKMWDTTNANFSEVGPLMVAESKNGQDAVFLAGPEGNGFEYQTFGAWQTGYGTDSGKAGAFSVGAATDAKNIPSTANATFTGAAGGFYLDGSGESDIMTADATLNADFANRKVDFATTNTELLDSGARADLNMTGSMTYGSGTNKLTGTVETASGMTGDIQGRFYGSGAQEVGGVFSLSGVGGERLGGSYGAKR